MAGVELTAFARYLNSRSGESEELAGGMSLPSVGCPSVRDEPACPQREWVSEKLIAVTKGEAQIEVEAIVLA